MKVKVKKKGKKPSHRPKSKDRLSVAQIEAALRASGGFQCLAAEQLGCSNANICNWIKRTPRLQKALKEIEEQKLDFCESKLMENISKNDVPSIFFYLKCKGKNRGYVEKQLVEHTGKDGGPLDWRYKVVKPKGD